MTTIAAADRGWGLLLTYAGILLGFGVAFFVVLPWFPKDNGTFNLTVMTSVVTPAAFTRSSSAPSFSAVGGT